MGPSELTIAEEEHYIASREAHAGRVAAGNARRQFKVAENMSEKLDEAEQRAFRRLEDVRAWAAAPVEVSGR